ncbi:MAG: hypothetical protein ACK55Z_19515 [bacterium]
MVIESAGFSVEGTYSRWMSLFLMASRIKWNSMRMWRVRNDLCVVVAMVMNE